MLDTVSGWYAGKEVVAVTFDPERTDFESLVRTAKADGCADDVWVRSEQRAAEARRVLGDKVGITQDDARTSKTSDLRYYLRRSPLRFVPMTTLQQVRVNADLGQQRDPLRWLSPRQLRAAKRVGDASVREELGLEEFPPLEQLWLFER